jgi:serine/threonine-protein kinase HipA
MNPATLIVVMNGERVGELYRTRGGQLRLLYDHEVFEDEFATPLSVAMPLVGRRYKGTVVDNWVSGLLPDRPEVLLRWRRDFGVRDLDAFSLLWHVGEDVAGAAQFVREDRLEALMGDESPDPLTESDVAQRLARLRADRTAWEPTTAKGQFSLAGSQAKIALHRDQGGWALPGGNIPTTHILKPAMADLPDQDVNEHLTMRTASLLGLRTASTAVESFDNERALVVRRYDRVLGSNGYERVHQEDMCQALGIRPGLKYETQGGPGVVRIVEQLRQLIPADVRGEDIDRFLDAIAFNWLVVGTDAHARNYALLLSGPDVRLAPLYDLNSFLPYSDSSDVDLAMRVGTYKYNPYAIGYAEWDQLAREARVDSDGLRKRAISLAQRLPDAAADAVAETRRDLPDLTSGVAKMYARLIAERAKVCARSLTQGASAHN